jgi:hypothetical protein
MTRAKPRQPQKYTAPKRTTYGFVQTGGILGRQIRKVSEKRGFAESRVLTQWAEIAGEAVAAITRPVKVSYGREGLGATLTLLCKGADAPMLQMQIPQVISRVNACYGYAAIARIRITQTSATGFSEDAPAYRGEAEKSAGLLSNEDVAHVEQTVRDIGDTELKQALANLGENIMSRSKTNMQK